MTIYVISAEKIKNNRKDRKMNDVRQLLKTKTNIETAMQRADPLMRLVLQRRLNVVCAEIEEAREEWHKLMEHVSDEYAKHDPGAAGRENP